MADWPDACVSMCMWPRAKVCLSTFILIFNIYTIIIINFTCNDGNHGIHAGCTCRKWKGRKYYFFRSSTFLRSTSFYRALCRIYPARKFLIFSSTAVLLVEMNGRYDELTGLLALLLVGSDSGSVFVNIVLIAHRNNEHRDIPRYVLYIGF